MISIQPYFNGLVDLLFPRVCVGCARKLFYSEWVICRFCEHDLPRCRFEDPLDNLMARQFWGRLELHAALAFCFYSRHFSFSIMMYQLKYNRCPEVGQRLGELFARDRLLLLHELKIDLLVPVPLHPSKRRKRGYNQSEEIANGIASILHVPVDSEILRRRKRGKSQTTKSRWSRTSEMGEVFYRHSEIPGGCRHIALVDDVFTTGATAEACCRQLVSIPGLKVSVLCLAFAWS